jgi:hypothetical protein
LSTGTDREKSSRSRTVHALCKTVRNRMITRAKSSG